MIVACIALVMATVGTGIAATQIRNNTIGAKELSRVKLRTATDLVDSQVSNHGDASAKCRAREQLLGGGATFAGATADDYADINLSGPTNKRTWAGAGYVDESETQDFTLVVTALCLAK